jgi:hypothetical protein
MLHKSDMCASANAPADAGVDERFAAAYCSCDITSSSSNMQGMQLANLYKG